jgi:hypothetical protein
MTFPLDLCAIVVDHAVVVVVAGTKGESGMGEYKAGNRGDPVALIKSVYDEIDTNSVLPEDQAQTTMT